MSEDQQRHETRSQHNESAASDVGARAKGEAQVVIGQADEVVVVERPAPGETVEIQTVPGQTYVLDFPPEQADVEVQGSDLKLTFDDNGDGQPDSQIIFENLVNMADSGNAPVFEIAGQTVDSGFIAERAVALAGAQDAPLEEVAAAPTGAESGVFQYSDDVGSPIDLLSGSGVIAGTTLAFGTLDLGDDTPLPLPLAAAAGGGSTADRINLALVIDTSGSMQHQVVVDGQAMTKIEAIDSTVEHLLDDLSQAGDEMVRVHMVSFAEKTKEAGTFDIVVDGQVDAAALQAAKDLVLQDGDDPMQVAKGGTNYEAGFHAALGWFGDDANTIDDPDVNQTIFISDGLPTHAFKGDDLSEVIKTGSAQSAVNHVLGHANLSGASPDTVSEFDGLTGPFKGTDGSVDAIGINADPAGENILAQVDSDGTVENVGGSPTLAAATLVAASPAAGGAGDDTLVGTLGDDTLAGGGGRDVFRWDGGITEHESDTVSDFQPGPGGDRLDLGALLPDAVDSGTPATDLTDYLSVTSNGTDTTLHVAPDSGGGSPTVDVVLAGVGDLTAGGSVSDAQVIQQLIDGDNLTV